MGFFIHIKIFKFSYFSKSFNIDLLILFFIYLDITIELQANTLEFKEGNKMVKNGNYSKRYSHFKIQ